MSAPLFLSAADQMTKESRLITTAFDNESNGLVNF